jgi:hypothetical protein
MRFHWTGEPRIDLYSGPAVPLRAYLESFWLVELFSDLDVGYPGFQRAITYRPYTEESILRNDPSPLIPDNVRSQEGFYRDKPMFGTIYFLLQRLTQTPDGYSAVVCQVDSSMYILAADGSYKPRFSGSDLGESLTRVDFSDHDPSVGAQPPVSPTAAQRGPIRKTPPPVQAPVPGWPAQAG